MVLVQQYLKWPFEKFGVSFLLSLNGTWLKWGTAYVGENQGVETDLDAALPFSYH